LPFAIGLAAFNSFHPFTPDLFQRSPLACLLLWFQLMMRPTKWPFAALLL
jgi:hypothetical protein